MESSLEIYFAVNCVMNGILIGIIAWSQGEFCTGKVVGAAVFGAFYAVAMQFQAFYLLRSIPAKVMLPFVLAAAAFHVETARQLMRGGVKLLIGTILTGGIAQLTSKLIFAQTKAGMIIGILAGTLALAIVLRTRQVSMIRCDVEIMIRSIWGQVRLNAFVDTGNRLSEPISGQPVIIVEEKRLRKALPDGFDMVSAMREIPKGFRLVGFGALGGSGQMLCFRPDELLVSYGSGWMRVSGVWIAIYPGKMPGEDYALAPAVIGCIEEPKGGRDRKKYGAQRGEFR